MNIDDEKQEVYQQETELNIIERLIPYIQNKTYIDIGAEKGAFANILVQKGFQGVLFEPCPKHHEALEKFSQKTGSSFFPYAVDEHDREAILYISCDENGEAQDYFHSLHYLANDPRVKHNQKVPVTCKSLKTLINEDIVPKEAGILKIDTEGNDLYVLRGMGELRPEVLVCEFFTEGLYAGWEQGHPDILIKEAAKFGYEHYVSVKRYHEYELVSFGPSVFFEEQWGNIIFLRDDIYRKTFDELRAVVIASERKLLNAPL